MSPRGYYDRRGWVSEDDEDDDDDSRGLPAKTRRWMQSLPPRDQVDLEVALLEASLSRATDDEARNIRQKVAAWKQFGGEMSITKHGDEFKKAITVLTDGVMVALKELEAADADAAAGKFSAPYAAAQRAKVIERARAADFAARDALAAYQSGARGEAQRLRAAAEAGLDPAGRVADEMERVRLAASRLDGEEFALQARAMLDAGQPRRAAMLLGVARDKGARLTDDLGRAVEEALDVSDGQRAEARAIEDALGQNVAVFTGARLRVLAASGLGTTPDGQMGSGRPGEAASASVAAKMEAYAGGQRSFPVGDGSDPPGGDA